MICKLFATFWILPWIGLIGGPTEAQKLSGILDESMDELHDAEIFRAVVESMRNWENHKKNHHRTKREVSRVCYEEVGCFEDTGPFSYLEMLPSHPKDVGTRFFMYGSRKARSVPMEVPADDINDKANNAIDPDLPTKVIVHGFGSGCEHVWVYEMRSALMSVHDCNIVCVDWSLGSAIPNYVRAAANTRLVGRQLAKLVRSLNVPLEKVHLIGFSLGAHVAGFAGAELANVSRITGLDPAGPLFESQDPRARLDETDATFVDVIHSNGEQLILGGLGSWQPMGDVDFYPNGGRMQTGCSNLFLGAVSDIIWSGSIEGRSLCNHRRAYKLFTDSVSPKCRFPAFPCETGYDGLLKGDCFPCDVNGVDRPCGDMGYYSDATSARGQLYLVTRDEEPFCAHQYQVKVYNSRGERPARSYGKLQVTLVGESNFNETFTMTRKDDEELLVGAVLQKIVVPHPAVENLQAIEIKYTAYSGWISSGLVSWSVDKVSILDSFGKSLSVCMRGLTLESGRSVYLPLYPGECNIPMDAENITTNSGNSTKSASMIMEPMEMSNEDKKVSIGIGPFTREHNYERMDNPPEDYVKDKETNRPQKGLGPFTKDQNTNKPINDESVQIAFVPKDGLENLSSDETKKSVASPWSYVDVSDAGSNSLENTDSERGRGFSGSNFVPNGVTSETTARNVGDTTILDYQGEVREPVLQIGKKETGRAMRLPEITEPILRPRGIRQNMKSEDQTFEEKSRIDADLEELATNSSRDSRLFTVQFLPERLAGILAQAERYARQTLLPLISHYTPSFVGSSRQERVKYFPPLTDHEDQEDSRESRVSEDPRTIGNTERSNEVETSQGTVHRVATLADLKVHDRDDVRSARINESARSEIRRSDSFASTSMRRNIDQEAKDSQQGDWIPIEIETNAKSARNSSRSMRRGNEKWIVSEDAIGWNPRIVDVEAGPDTKIDDWIPIDATRKSADPSKEATENDAKKSAVVTMSNELSTSTTILPILEASRIIAGSSFDDSKVETTTLRSKDETTTSSRSQERKFIPLVDFENRDSYLAPMEPNEEVGSTKLPIINVGNPTHIQKIPGTTTVSSLSKFDDSKRAMIFPYAYERKRDPRTRYIPLIPIEEMGKIDDTTIERAR